MAATAGLTPLSTLTPTTTTAVVDPTGGAAWSNALITTTTVGVAGGVAAGSTVQVTYALRAGGELTEQFPGYQVEQALQPVSSNVFGLFTLPANTAVLISLGPTGAETAQYFGTGSDPLYPTDLYGRYTFLPGNTLASTFFVNANGQTAGGTFAT